MTLKDISAVLTYTEKISVYDWTDYKRTNGEAPSVGHHFDNSTDLFMTCIQDDAFSSWTVSIICPIDGSLVIDCNM